MRGNIGLSRSIKIKRASNCKSEFCKEIPVTLPISKAYPPMEAMPATSLPEGPQWQYEPKWDGFRCLVFRDNKRIDLQSKSGKPLTRYFPELVAALGRLRATRCVLDGEIVIPVDGDLSFDQLLMRIHPSAKRAGPLVGSLLLGLYNKAGELDHVGFTSSISAEARPSLTRKLEWSGKISQRWICFERTKQRRVSIGFTR